MPWNSRHSSKLQKIIERQLIFLFLRALRCKLSIMPFLVNVNYAIYQETERYDVDRYPTNEISGRGRM